ncbi:MAG TPA: hypothetical protein VFH51_04110 [Myxococcota bacterium]|nr:hypothetical protein [Myxococcota bacterium]
MKLILAANSMEHPRFAAFVRDAAAAHPDAAFVMCGDLLNIFPEPGEDLRNSIFYELYGELLVEEMQRVHATHFADLAHSRFVRPLHDLFDAGGDTYEAGLAAAGRRYARVFGELRAALGGRTFYFIPGNMDYPQLTSLYAAASPNLVQLDGDIVSLGDLRLGGVGGIPRTAQPFHAVAQVSPYELSEAAYERRLHAVWGAEILVTHLAPEESPILERFVRESPVRLVICRAPFNLGQERSCRGMLACQAFEGRTVFKVRPFDYPENVAFVVELCADPLADPRVELFTWHDGHVAEAPAAVDALPRFCGS